MATNLTEAREANDPDAYAQGLIAGFGLEDARKLLPSFINEYNPAPETFWKDVATLLRLETQSDETVAEAQERRAKTGDQF